MALTGGEKEMRMSSSLGYNPLDNLDESHHMSPHEQLIIHQQEKPQAGGTPDRSKSFKAAAATTAVVYRECLKNHAASMGGNVTDGCREFMPSGEEGTLEALKCAACNCHRNFHRKDTPHGSSTAGGASDAIVLHHHHHALHPPPPPFASPPVNRHSGHWTSVAAAQPVKMAFGGSGGGGSAATDSSSEELNFNAYHSSNAAVPPPPSFVLSKKRFRTKFTQDQKDRMLEFAEKLGWRIPREDDAEVQRFCAEVGVKRQVFKVWMHNNKNSSKKNPQES